jgi:hypothetical protein
LTDARSETLANLWQAALGGSAADALCLVELRGFEPLTPCMPCHPHPFTRPSAALPSTASVLLRRAPRRGAVVGREAACGIAADNLLTDRRDLCRYLGSAELPTPARPTQALSDYAAFPIPARTCVRYAGSVETWHDLDVGRPLAAPLEQCAQLLDVDLVTVRELAAKVEPYLRADGTRIWSLTQLERQLRPEVYGRRRGGYLDRRRTRQ